MTSAVRWAGVAALSFALLVAAWLLYRDEDVNHSPASSAVVTGPSVQPLPAASERPAAVQRTADPVSAGAATDEQVAGTDSVETSSAAGLSHVSGGARNDLSQPLARHTVEIRAGDTLEGSAITQADGSFRIEGLEPGPKVLSLLGPGPGDVPAGILEWRGRACGIEPVQEERSLNVTLPIDGLDRIDLLVRGHGARLIVMRIVDEDQEPLDRTFFDIEGFPNDPSATDEDGILCRPIHVDQAQVLRVTMNTRTRDAPFPVDWYLPLEIRVEPQPEVQDLGTLVMARMAGLKVTLVDARNGTGIGDADVRMHVTGGDQPAADVRGSIWPDGSYVLWSGRTEGVYELDVTAVGYQPAHQVGVLVAGDALVPLELILEPR